MLKYVKIILIILFIVSVALNCLFIPLFLKEKRENHGKETVIASQEALIGELQAMPAISVQLNATMNNKFSNVIGKQELQNISFEAIWKDLVITTKKEIMDSIVSKTTTK